MTLRARYDSEDDIPEAYRELFTEKKGRFELTEVSGLQTTESTERLQRALTKEREAHETTKGRLSPWSGMDHEETMAKLDRVEELEAAAKGEFDSDAVEEMVSARVEAKMKAVTAPLERQIAKLQSDAQTLSAENADLTKRDYARQLEDIVRPAMDDLKVVAEHREDALMFARAALKRTDDGDFATEDGLDAKSWLAETLERKPGWLPRSEGAGLNGGGGGGSHGQDNPWSKEGWNMTAQGSYAREHGADKAAAMASRAGSSIGAIEPPK